MSMTAGKIFDWLNTFKEDDLIGIDEGGLCLVEVGGAAYLEIGGVAEQIEDEEEEQDELCDVGMHTCKEIRRTTEDGKTVCPDCDTEESQNASC